MTTLRQILSNAFLIVGIAVIFFDYNKGIGMLIFAAILDIADTLDKTKN